MIRKVLIPLDAIIDTRISTMALLNDDAAEDLIVNNYSRRISDELSKFTDKVSDAEFKKAYANRTVDSLIGALPTKALLNLRKTVDQLEHDRAMGTPTAGPVVVDINIHPYQLTDKEIQDYIDCVRVHMPRTVKVDAVSLKPEELHPKAIVDRQYCVLYIYDYELWFRKVFTEAKKCPHRVGTDVTVICPQLAPSIDGVIDINQSLDPGVKNRDPFATLEHVVLTWVNIRMSFVSSEMFSLVT